MSYAESTTDIIEMMNHYGKRRVPFLFIIDFDIAAARVIPLSAIDPEDILYDFDGITNAPLSGTPGRRIEMRKFPVPYSRYRGAFDYIVACERAGDSYLVNLTFPTRVETGMALREMFFLARAKYRLYYKDRFVLFSPETFVRIKNGIISSYPMKGTIDASLPNAEDVILSDPKEFAEHVTIVDLIRNDLNMVARDIAVKRFRYLDLIQTMDKRLLQVSSEITGSLTPGYHSRIGEIITRLLPAGSVTGAPKKKTVEIIKSTEGYDRGFYTGITGCFDGYNLDSAVMIRFIEKEGDILFFKSGGGITVYSDPESEYRELIDKVNVPIS